METKEIKGLMIKLKEQENNYNKDNKESIKQVYYLTFKLLMKLENICYELENKMKIYQEEIMETDVREKKTRNMFIFFAKNLTCVTKENYEAKRMILEGGILNIVAKKHYINLLEKQTSKEEVFSYINRLTAIKEDIIINFNKDDIYFSKIIERNMQNNKVVSLNSDFFNPTFYIEGTNMNVVKNIVNKTISYFLSQDEPHIEKIKLKQDENFTKLEVI